MTLEPGEIEVFRTGDYPQGKYTASDLDDMAATYDPVNSHEAFVGFEHKEGGPSYGWFSSLRRAGESLVGKLGQVDATVHDAYHSGKFKKWSAEIYDDFDGTGKKYLKALKFLGATPPQIKGLKQAVFGEHGSVSSFEMALSEPHKGGSTVTVPNDPAKPAGQPAAPATPAQPAAPVQPVVPPQPTAEFAEVKAENATLKAQLEELKQGQAKMARGLLKENIATFAESAKRDGKLIAGDFDAGVEAFMESLDGVSVTTGEGDAKKEQSARHWFQEFVGRRLAPVPTGKVGEGTSGAGSGGTGAGSETHFDEESVRVNAEIEKYVKENPTATFAEAHAIIAHRFRKAAPAA